MSGDLSLLSSRSDWKQKHFNFVDNWRVLFTKMERKLPFEKSKVVIDVYCETSKVTSLGEYDQCSSRESNSLLVTEDLT